MDNEKELVRFILQYLLDNHFESKSDMARQLDIRHRTMQRVFEQLHNDKAKGSTIVLDRALLFCAKRNISVDQLFREYQDYMQGATLDSVHQQEDDEIIPSGNYLLVPAKESCSDEIQKSYEVYVSYLRVLASFVCPRCPHYCNPCGDPDWIQSDCALALSARRLLDTASKSKTEAE